MTSVRSRQNNFYQRKLGILRSSHPLTRKHSTAEKIAYIAGFSAGFAIDGNHQRDTVLPSNDQNHEKIRRLHQIRTENAVHRMKNCSAEDVHRANYRNRDFHSLRCSTAPSCRTVREFLKDKVGAVNNSETNSAFDEKPSKVVLMGTPRQRRRLATFPAVDSSHKLPPNDQSSFLYPLERSYLEQHIFPASTAANGSFFNQISSTKLRRTTSAPAEMYRITRSKLSENINSEPIKSFRFRLGNILPVHNADDLKQQNKKKSRIYYPAKTKKPTTPRSGYIKMNDGPLGIVGERFRQNKPPVYVKTSYRLPIKKPCLSSPKKFSNSRSECELSFTTEQNNRLSSPSNPSYSGCGCRSVRFNCTSNLIHEYMASEPIAIKSTLKT